MRRSSSGPEVKMLLPALVSLSSCSTNESLLHSDDFDDDDEKLIQRRRRIVVMVNVPPHQVPG